MLAEQILFFVAASAAIAGALGVVLLRNPFYSVLSLVAHLVALAVLFLILRSEMLAASQVVVYAGAVMVLYVFVTAYIGGRDEDIGTGGGVPAFLGPLVAIGLLVEISIAVIGSSLGALDTRGADIGAGFGTPEQFGELLLTKFLVAFEAASFLLLIAAVGAVVLARRRRGLEPEDSGMPGPPYVEPEPAGDAAGNPPEGRIPTATAEGR